MRYNHPLIYSFRTNKHLEKVSRAGIDVFVFGKLKEDLERFKEIIKTTKPKLIIGIAEVSSQSRFETKAVNHFGPKGTINRAGHEEFELFVPSETQFLRSTKVTKTFCNWTAYRISEAIQKTDTKLAFLHFNKNDIDTVIDFLKKE